MTEDLWGDTLKALYVGGRPKNLRLQTIMIQPVESDQLTKVPSWCVRIRNRPAATTSAPTASQPCFVTSSTQQESLLSMFGMLQYAEYYMQIGRHSQTLQMLLSVFARGGVQNISVPSSGAHNQPACTCMHLSALQ